jgi:nucleoid-associated protein YgaU
VPGVQAPGTAGTPSTPGAPGAPATAQPATGGYTVQSGDCLSEIAYTHHLDGWQQFYQHNAEVVGGNPNLILPGQHLQFP